MRRATRRGALGAGALALLLGAGGGLFAGAASSPMVQSPRPLTTAPGGNDKAGGQQINDPAAKAPGFQRNALGLSYGSAANAPRPDLEPDLVWVVTDQGGDGYVYNKGLATPPPKTAAEAAASARSRTLTAYAADGVTKVGTFTSVGAAASDGKD